MGNQLSGTVPQQIHPLEYYLSELNYYPGEIMFDCNMGSTRFFKVARIKQTFNLNQLPSILNRIKDETVDLSSNESKMITQKIPGLGVAKIFVITDPSLPLSSHKEKIKRLREKLRDNPSCLTYADVIINEKVAILIRQYIKYNLYDRLSTRPFMNLFEKKWITFQILKCIDSIHKAQEIHGDIKIENILLTSSGWVLLTDFATYKPSYLPEDNPGDFSYFFDTSRRRTCNIAPERFVSESFFNEQLTTFSSSQSNNQTLMNQNIVNFVKPEMDLFSVGCVIGELFIEESLFDLSALLSYKMKGSSHRKVKKDSTDSESSPTPTHSPVQSRSNDKLPPQISVELPFNEDNKLKKVNFIEIKEVRDLIFNLIDLNPSNRKDCSKHLKELFECGVMPKYFFYLYNYLSNLNPLSPDEKIIKLDKDFDQLSEQILEEDCNGFLIIINNVLSCCRALIHTYARLTGLNLIIRVIKKIDNDNLKSNIILERILPYIINTITKDTCPKVKSHSIHCLTQLLNQVEIVSVSDKNVFPDYILPALYQIVQDEYALVRTTLAKHLPSLSRIALKFLNICPSTAKPTTEKTDDETNEENNKENTDLNQISNRLIDIKLADQLEISSQKSIATYNKELKALQKSFQSISYGILTDKEISVRVELMLSDDLVELCTFFGKQKTNEVIFSHLITFLNERIDFELRFSFYQCIRPIAAYLGIQSSPVIKPLLQQGFTDAEETVINQSILTTAYLCNSQLMMKKTALELVSDAMPLIVHPNLSIRHSMVQFVVNCSQMLSLAELNCRLLPMIRPFLKDDQRDNLLYLSNTITDTSLLLDSLVDPVPRSIYDLIFNKINSTYILEHFFETLEKYPIKIQPNNETILNVSALDAVHLAGSPLISAGNRAYSNPLIVSSSTPSNMSISSYHQQANSSTLSNFLDLLIDEGLDETVKSKLLKMSNLMIRIYKQIKSTKSFINNSQQAVVYKYSTLPRQPLSPSNSSLQNRLINSNSERFDDVKQVKKDNKRLYSLNLFNQKYLPSSNDWHIPSTISINSSNIESFTNYNLNQQDDGESPQFELAKEAKENMNEERDQEVVSISKGNIEEYSVDESTFDQKNGDLITCPPCVHDLQSLFKHRQHKFGELFYNNKIIDFEMKTNEANDQSTSMSSSATTIISADCLQNATNMSELTSLQDGHYAVSNYRPKGKLIANLTEHSKAISRILTIGNSLFFSSSHDGTIKLWNGDKMNQGTCLVNRSKQTFKMERNDEYFHGMCYSSGKELLIGYSNKANLYVIKMDNQSSKMTIYQTVNDFCKTSMNMNTQSWNKGNFLKGYEPASSPLIDRKSTSLNNNNAQNYSITDISSNTPFVFICSFSNSCVKGFDLRLPLTKSIWTMNTAPDEGLITCIGEGDSCVFAGTLYGHIITFDTRFQLRSNTMSYSVQRKVRRLLYTPKGLYAAVEGYNEISLWDCESSSRTKTLWASNAPPLSNKISTNSVYGLVSSNYSNNDFKGLISCGSDARIRYWDLANPHKSYLIADHYFRASANTITSSSSTTASSNVAATSSSSPNLNRNSHVTYMGKFIEGMHLIQEFDHNAQLSTDQQQQTQSTSKPEPTTAAYTSYNSWYPQDISPAHKNIITDIIWLNKSNLLVSGSKDGCVKLWK